MRTAEKVNCAPESAIFISHQLIVSMLRACEKSSCLQLWYECMYRNVRIDRVTSH